MDIYHLVLFLHVVAAFGLIVAFTLESIALRGLRQAVGTADANASLRGLRLVRPVFAASAITILITGIYMWAAGWRGTAWTIVALVSLVLIALIGALLTGIRTARLEPALQRTQGALPAGLRPALRDRVLLTSLRTRWGVVIGIAFLMTVKPSLAVSLLVVIVGGAIGAISSWTPASRSRDAVSREAG